MNKIVIKTGLIIYFSLALVLVIYLLSFNKFGFSQFGSYTLFDLSEKIPLMIVKQDSKRVQVGDEIYFYNVYDSTKEIRSAIVTEINITNEKEITFHLKNDFYLSSSYLIGRKTDVIEIIFLGVILNFFSQKLVYLSIFIVPIFVCLIYQIRHLNKDFLRRR